MTLDRKVPKKMLRIAAILTVVFLVGHLAGLRELTSIISGTLPATDWELLLGTFYVLSWFAFVLVAPLLALGGGVHLLAIHAVEKITAAREARSATMNEHHAPARPAQALR